MQLENAIATSPAPSVPERLKDRLVLSTTCAFTKHEYELFSIAFSALDKALQSSPSPSLGIHAWVIFTDTDTVSICDPPEDRALGRYLSIITYNLQRIRAAKYNDIQFLTVALEELCHCFWCIRDELAVEDKVLELMHLIFPALQKSDLYNLDWSPVCHK